MWDTIGVNNHKMQFAYSPSYVLIKNYKPNIKYTVLEDFNYTVAVAKEVCRIKGLYDEAEKNINDALTLIQKISEKNREYTKHNELSNYYSFVLAYYNFAKSPTGSFNQLSNTIDNYQTQIITQKNKLSIYFE